MNKSREDSHPQDKSRLVAYILSVVRNNTCLAVALAPVLALVLAVAASFVIVLPTKYLPDYIALPLVFALGMTVWALIFGFPKRASRRFWVFSALTWASAICLTYSDAFNQHNHALNGWYWVGIGLGGLDVVLGIAAYFRGKGTSNY
jgi:hypothetical protein